MYVYLLQNVHVCIECSLFTTADVYTACCYLQRDLVASPGLAGSGASAYRVAGRGSNTAVVAPVARHPNVAFHASRCESGVRNTDDAIRR